MTLGIRCWLCHLPLALSHHGICSRCLKNLPSLPICCPCCGLPAGENNQRCQRCQTHSPYWQYLIAVTDYCSPLKEQINQIKFNQKIQFSFMLARLMLLKWLEARRTLLLPKPDIVTTVPLHRIKQWYRGFNQTEQLAKPLARWLSCTYEPTLLSRHYSLQSQKNLSAQARRSHLKGIFECHRSIQGKHIALIDDIVTTGSTVNEISQLLQQHGAASVQIICVCRTL